MSGREELAKEIKRMAQEYENSWVQIEDPAYYGGKYNKTLYDMQNDTIWSYPAYLLLSSWWNDSLNWADQILQEKKKTKPGKTPPGMSKI